MLTKKEAVRIVEDTIHLHPKAREIEHKTTVIEDKHSTVDGYHFCRECSTWTPREPPEIKTLAKEWMRVFNREVEKARKTKTT